MLRALSSLQASTPLGAVEAIVELVLESKGNQPEVEVATLARHIEALSSDVDPHPQLTRIPLYIHAITHILTSSSIPKILASSLERVSGQLVATLHLPLLMSQSHVLLQPALLHALRILCTAVPQTLFPLVSAACLNMLRIGNAETSNESVAVIPLESSPIAA